MISNISAQNITCNTITADMKYTVSSIKIYGRWVPKELQARAEQAIGIGQFFDPGKISTAEELVRSEIVKEEDAFALRLAGSTSILYITTNACPVADSQCLKLVQVVIRPYYLRIDLYNIGNNILPIPRTAKPTFYKEVPAFLLATSPFIGLVNDRRFGIYGMIQTSTDLLNIKGNVRPKANVKRNLLDLDLNYKKSFNFAFYNFAGALRFIHPIPIDKGIGWNVGGMYSKSLQPLSESNFDNGVAKFSGSINGNAKIFFIDKYIVSGGVQFSQNSYSLLNSKYQTPETGYDFNTLGDGRVGNGLARIGLWFNAGIPGNNLNLKPYQRIAGKLGYAFQLGNGHNNADVETTAGIGHIWGTPPVYNEYFAGNVSPDFLYTPLQSFTNMSFPAGPVIRSLGEREGGFFSSSNSVGGGTAYWGLNVNVSIPIAKWARPLIPDIVIQDEPRVITMRSAIKGQVNTAKSFIADDLALNGGLSDDAADSAAEKIVNKDIKPTINYLADRANIYSIKPILFFDIAEISKRNTDNRIWTAAGAGLQINIVNARLDIGYMQTLVPKNDASKGNFLMRFSVQNFY